LLLACLMMLSLASCVSTIPKRLSLCLSESEIVSLSPEARRQILVLYEAGIVACD
jgi:hypothetical protein